MELIIISIGVILFSISTILALMFNGKSDRICYYSCLMIIVLGISGIIYGLYKYAVYCIEHHSVLDWTFLSVLLMIVIWFSIAGITCSIKRMLHKSDGVIIAGILCIIFGGLISVGICVMWNLGVISPTDYPKYLVLPVVWAGTSLILFLSMYRLID